MRDKIRPVTKIGSQLTAKQRRRRLEFADRVAALAPEAPDDSVRQMVYSTVNRIRQQFGFSDAEKKVEIERLIRLGAATIMDVVNESHFHKDDVLRLTKEMEAEGIIVFRRMLNLGVGRPQIYIFAKDRPNPPKSIIS